MACLNVVSHPCSDSFHVTALINRCINAIINVVVVVVIIVVINHLYVTIPRWIVSAVIEYIVVSSCIFSKGLYCSPRSKISCIERLLQLCFHCCLAVIIWHVEAYEINKMSAVARVVAIAAFIFSSLTVLWRIYCDILFCGVAVSLSSKGEITLLCLVLLFI